MTKLEFKIDQIILALRFHEEVNYKEWERFELKEAQERLPPPTSEEIILLLEECKKKILLI